MKKIILAIAMAFTLNLSAEEFTEYQKGVMADAIELSGFGCGYVNSARLDGMSGNIIAYCDDYSSAFRLIHDARGWHIEEFKR